jgi:hypothetical protein
MSHTKAWTADDDARIDDLVDGKLDDANRRALLTRCEVEPEGWRRCALAFLEAQCWRDALRPLAQPPSAARSSSLDYGAGQAPRVGRGQWSRFARTFAAAAACVTLFSLGWLISDASRGKRPSTAGNSQNIAARQIGNGGAGETETTSGAGQPQGALPVPSSAAGTVRTANPRIVAEKHAASLASRSAWGNPRGVAQAGPLSEADRKDLEHRGFEVETHRRMVTVPLRDGRRVNVPVGTVSLRRVGNRTI